MAKVINSCCPRSKHSCTLPGALPGGGEACNIKGNFPWGTPDASHCCTEYATTEENFSWNYADTSIHHSVSVKLEMENFSWVCVCEKYFFVCRLLLGGCMKLAETFNASLICAYTPNLTSKQRELCVQVPDVMVVMNEVRQIFGEECSWQFKTSRWNCTGVTPPIYDDIQMEGMNCADKC